MIHEEKIKFVFRIGFLEGFCAAKRMPDYDKAEKELEDKLKRANLIELLDLREYKL